MNTKEKQRAFFKPEQLDEKDYLKKINDNLFVPFDLFVSIDRKFIYNNDYKSFREAKQDALVYDFPPTHCGQFV